MHLMDKRFKYFFATIFYLVFSQSYAQTISNSGDLLGWSQLPEKIDVNTIEGTPYLNDDFVIGEVYFGDRYKTTPVPIRLNLHSDELEYIENDVVLAFGEPELIDKVVMDEEIFIYLNNNIFSAKPSGFLKMSGAKSPSMLTKMKIYCFKDAPKPFSPSKPIRFERAKDEYYIMKSEDEIIKITSVKKLINILGDDSSALTKFAEEENISVDNGADLSRLLDYYHQLSEQDL
jgi:hypothetical protein